MKSTSSRNVYFARGIRVFKEWYGPRYDGRSMVGSAPGDNGHWVEKKIYGYRYYAISKDKSSIITWFEDDNNLDGVIREKNEYYRVPKEEFLPKAVNYDFLNE